MNVSQKALITVLLAGFGGVLVAYSQVSHGDVECSTYTNTSEIPTGYAAPYDVFSAAKNMLIKATCDATSATIAAGTTGDGRLVYQYGYQWRNGTWQKYTFTGGTPAGIWIQGVPTVRLSRTAAEMSTTNYVVAYTCQSIDNVWKCGCRDAQCAQGMWQLQAFKKSDESLPSTDGIWGNYNELMTAYVTPNAATPGSRVAVTGAGFSTNSNTVLLGKKSIKNVVADTNHSLSFTIPADMPTGIVYVKVANDKGTSSTSTRGAFLLVKKPGTSPPTITSITPTSGPYGTRVTIRGTNFTPTNNYLATGFSMMNGLTSADGTTITATIAPFPNEPEAQKGGTPQALGKSYTLRMYVINENGMSPKPVSFAFDI